MPSRRTWGRVYVLDTPRLLVNHEIGFATFTFEESLKIHVICTESSMIVQWNEIYALYRLVKGHQRQPSPAGNFLHHSFTY